MALKEQTEDGTARQMIHEDQDFVEPEGRDLLKIDLACGSRRQEGYLGVDRVQMEGVDKVFDLLKFPWPLESNSVYEFICYHFVEHIPHQLFGTDIWNEKDGLIQFMEEVYRCLMPQGKIAILAPYYTSVRAWQDPTHVRAITDVTFAYFGKVYAQSMGVEHYTGSCDFELLSRTYLLNPKWESKSDDARDWAMKHYWNVVDDVRFELRALK